MNGSELKWKTKGEFIVKDGGDIPELLQLILSNEGIYNSHAADGNLGMAMLNQSGWDTLIFDPYGRSVAQN